MAIVISLTDLEAIQTYNGMKAYLIDTLELSAEGQLQVPNFIRLGEKRLDRLIQSARAETVATLTALDGFSTVSLPSDFGQMRTVYLADKYMLDAVSYGALASYIQQDRPVVYALSGGALHIAPGPKADYQIKIAYAAKLPPLSNANQTNWLLEDHPDAYLYAALVHAAAYLEDGDLATSAEIGVQTSVAEINARYQKQRTPGPLRMRAPVVV